VGATYFCATRILRLLGVDGRVAAIAAGVVLISPLSVLFYQEAGHGFEAENLVPALCLIPVLFPASAADDRVDRDGNCRHQREGGRADSGGYRSNRSRR